ncbi:DUF4231 domain-containing protein [Neobacillus jeddahensis]|uniref:DUF4231 domain-containing protein n=1 Tax=Neobacillus jeddahensis TaxID=1461580 RepID=UPI0005A69124|nr:DUF4231 domain-containing protein [Neobacillus jeddahensis]
MNNQLKIKILIEDINHNIEIYEKRRKSNKYKSLFLKVSSLIGSAIITVLLGLKSAQNNNFLSDITLILSAGITIFNGIEGFFNHLGLWVKDVTTLAHLRELKRDFEFYIAGEPEDEISTKILTTYKNRLQDICKNDLKSWAKIKEEQLLSEKEEGSQGDGSSGS